jgi:hypothetical protein
MTPRHAVLVLVGVLTVMLAWVLALPPLPGVGSRILLDALGHGVHRSDTPAILAWGMGLTTCGWLWRRV